MRVIAGKAKGRMLIAPEGLNTRPIMAKMKEALFSMWQFDIYGANFLDLFAGSGAFGAECISRGASKVVFVDKESKAINTIKQNTKNMSEDFEIIQSDFESALASFENRGLKFDLVYLDPPFASKFVQKALEMLDEKHLLKDGAVLVVERDLQNDLQNAPECYIIRKTKKYGTIFVDVLCYEK